MIVSENALAIPEILEHLLASTPPAGGVLSVYIDTSPERGVGQAFLIACRDRLKAIRAELPHDRRARFDAAAAQAEAVITRSFSPGHPGLAVFTSGDEDYVFAVPLPKRPAETVRFADLPAIAPLAAAIDDAERAAVLLFDKERARIFTIFLGEIEEQHSLFDEVPGKQQTGGWFALSQKRYERHHEDHVLRHATRAIAALRDELARHPFDRLLIAGPDEAVALLEDHLPRPLRTRLAGRLNLELFASDAEVLAAVRIALAEIERQQEVEAVCKLLDAAGSPRVALGPDAVMAALNEGRVHQLFVSDGALGNAYEQAITAAFNQGAQVEVVSGEAADLLAAHGGTGARTRWG